MSYGKKMNDTTSIGTKTRFFEPKRILRRAADISAKAAIIIAAAAWLSGGVFQSAADTSDGETYVLDTRTEEVQDGDFDFDSDSVSNERAAYTAADTDDSGRDDGFLNPTIGTLTSSFGTRWGRRHNGIDIGADEGTEIYAAKDGRVIFSGVADGYGNYIRIDHGGGFQTAYGHCCALAVNNGDEVKRGQVIAYVGSTGNSTGPHLHFEVKIDDEFKNPLDYVVY